jgi:hypothetical protein
VNTPLTSPIEGRPILSLHKFCEHAGISNVTAWRWRKNGWLTAVNIAGRPYLTDKALADFMRRVEAGEFAKEPKVPKRRAVV